MSDFDPQTPPGSHGNTPGSVPGNTPGIPASAPATGDPAVPQEERTMAMFTHLLALSGVVVPVPGANVIGPLILWSMKKDTMPFVNEQGKEAMNFQITVLIAVVICIVLMFLLIGILLLPVVGLAALIFTIIAAIKANGGEHYRYPFAIRFIK